MVAETSSQFVARALCLLPFSPVDGVRVGGDDRCWLCGSAVDAPGWDRRDAFGPTFTNVNLARVPTSFTVCQPCAAVSRGESWAAYAARRPDLGLVTKHPIGWRSYPHAVYGAVHEVPKRDRWRELLTDPPEPPFVFVIPTSKQKHLLFRARLGLDRDRYPVQWEEDSVWVERAELLAALVPVEAMLALGISRTQVETGQYHQESIRKAGLRAWRDAEAQIAPWRQRNPALVAIVCMIATAPERGQHDLRI